MDSAKVWRWLRSELLGLVIFGFILFGLPHFLDSLSRFYLKDILGFAALWFAVALIRTGIGTLWRRRSKKDPQALDESTLSQYQR